MPKENYFVITLELSFLALSFFFLIEVTSISAIQINYKRWERTYRVPALVGGAEAPSPAGQSRYSIRCHSMVVISMDVSICVADWAPSAYNHTLANLRLIFVELAVKCATINSKNLGRVSMIAARFFQDA
jgi:hypothetical protein